MNSIISILNIFNILQVHIWIIISTCPSLFNFLLVLSTSASIFGTFSCLQNWFQIFKFIVVISSLPHYSPNNCRLHRVYHGVLVLANCHKVVLLGCWVCSYLLIYRKITVLFQKWTLVGASLGPFAASGLMGIWILLDICIWKLPLIFEYKNIWFLVFGVLVSSIMIKRLVSHVIIFNLMKF